MFLFHYKIYVCAPADSEITFSKDVVSAELVVSIERYSFIVKHIYGNSDIRSNFLMTVPFFTLYYSYYLL